MPSHFSEIELVKAHSHSSHNLEEVQKSSDCGCFHCLKIFFASQVTEWLDDGTVLCPDCGIDSVLGSMSGYPLTKDFLVEMNGRWFGNTKRLSRQKKARNVKMEIAVITITGLVTEILLPNNFWVLILVIAGAAGVFLFAIYDNLRTKRKVRSGAQVR
jgi:hypothetical protein